MDPSGEPDISNNSGRRWPKDLGAFLTLGLQLALSVVVFFFLGRWLDGVFDTSPWLMLTGAAVGITGGMIKFLRTAMELGRNADARMKQERRGQREN
jgi:ATP synthase protein I